MVGDGWRVWCWQTEQLNKNEGQRGADRAELLRNLKVREREIESMLQAIQGLAQDMWLRMESEAKLMWSGLSDYRLALEDSARAADDTRVQGHQQVPATRLPKQFDPWNGSILVVPKIDTIVNLQPSKITRNRSPPWNCIFGGEQLRVILDAL